MRKFFPLSFRGKSLKSVILAALFYALIMVAVRVMTSLLLGISALPEALSVLLNLIWQLVRLYAFAGIAVAVLYATDCLEKKS